MTSQRTPPTKTRRKYASLEAIKYAEQCVAAFGREGTEIFVELMLRNASFEEVKKVMLPFRIRQRKRVGSTEHTFELEVMRDLVEAAERRERRREAARRRSRARVTSDE